MCAIYRSARKADSYLFVKNEGDFSKVPGSLLLLLGELQWVMNLELTPERKLAQADVQKVMQNLEQSGFYLQLPPGKAGENAPQ